MTLINDRMAIFLAKMSLFQENNEINDSGFTALHKYS